MATILIVEDRQIDRQLLATLLGYRGHQVLEASDGEQGLQVLEQAHPDLVISDLLMPTVDGYEFVQRLRQLPGVSQTPVIFYTASYHEREARELARRCGVLDILTKPSEPETILAKVDSVLASAPRAVKPADTSAFTESHLQVVSAKLLDKVAALEASEQRLSAIVDVAKQIAAEREPLALLRRVCTAARDVTLAQWAVLGIVSDDGSGLETVCTSGLPESIELRLAPHASTVLADVLVERKAVRARNPAAIGVSGLPAAYLPVQSWLAVPIASSGTIYGWLELHNKLGRDEFSPEDERIVATLGTQAGVAYENAILYDGLLRNAERTRFALAAARMGVWEVDLDSGRVTWSETLAPLFGLSPVDAPKTTDAFLSLIHPDDRSAVEESIGRVAAGDGRDYQVEFRTIWPDRTAHWIGGRAQVVRDAKGKAARLLGIGMDIGDRKALEEQFRQAQKMEAVGQLAGGIAHDFNNLLTAILGFSSFLADSLAPNDRRRSDVDEIVRAGQRAAALTKQLLAFSRKQVLRPSTLNLNTVVAGMEQMLRPLIGEQIELMTVLAADLGSVRADVGQLEQVLMNLVLNARDAMPSGGRLTIETANVELDDSYAMQHVAVRPGHYVMIAVSDSGVGMSPETKRHMFEPFFTTKERGKGTGLGLATVYGIVRQSDGHVWVYSEPNRGATFKIYLPRVHAEVTKVRTDVEAPAGGSETVLVVEDERAVRFLARTVLERAGYRVFEAANAQEAEVLVAAGSDSIDLLVTDVIMPGLTGPALFQRLVVKSPTLKVLYVSGYTDDTIVRHGQLAPGIEFLQKPFTASGLVRKVREVLDSSPEHAA